ARSKTDVRSRPNAVHASFGLTRDVTSSGRRQARGGRKGGLPACEENELAANDAVIFAKAEGNTMTADVPRKLKHLSAQVAMAPQSSWPSRTDWPCADSSRACPPSWRCLPPPAISRSRQRYRLPAASRPTGRSEALQWCERCSWLGLRENSRLLALAVK